MGPDPIKLVSTASSLTLQTSTMPGNAGTLTLEVVDATPAVRRGANLLRESRSWPIVLDGVLPGTPLMPGASLRSISGRYRLSYQSDGNLVLYDDQTATALWHTGTGGTSAGQALMQTDGNLVVYDATGMQRWISGTSGNPGARLVVQDDGNLVIYSATGTPLWHRLQ